MNHRPGARAWIVSAVAASAFAAMAGCGSGAPSVVAHAPAPSNLDVMRSLVSGIGGEVLDSAGSSVGDTVLLDVDSSESAWIARTELAALLGKSGRTVSSGAGSTPGGTRWNVRGLSLAAIYRDIRKPGIFSGAVVDRVVSASLTSELTRGGRVLYAGVSARNMIDTVDEGIVADLEAGSPAGTRGEVPDMQTFDRFIEPLVIIGAAGVAIFLFFQVRS